MLETTPVSRPLEVFVKINTGMNRLGVRPADVAARRRAPRRSATRSATLRLMTHLARADEPDGLTDQLAAFDAACRGLPYPRSIANSAGVVRFADVGGDIVRPGIMLYGASPFPHDSAERHRRAAGDDAALRDHRRAGARRGRHRRLRRDVPRRRRRTASASSPAGTPTAIRDRRANGTPVLVCGKTAPLAGRVSMDMLTVDLSDVPEARVGSPGRAVGRRVAGRRRRDMAGTVGYELLCAVAPRVPFVVSNLGRLDLEL